MGVTNKKCWWKKKIRFLKKRGPRAFWDFFSRSFGIASKNVPMAFVNARRIAWYPRVAKPQLEDLGGSWRMLERTKTFYKSFGAFGPSLVLVAWSPLLPLLGSTQEVPRQLEWQPSRSHDMWNQERHRNKMNVCVLQNITKTCYSLMYKRICFGESIEVL